MLNLLFTAVWKVEANRRLFFEQYAKEHNFDHRDPEGWHWQPKENFYDKKVCFKIEREFF
jgi:hypothetical protein